jgi:hypothetical protein
MVLGVILHLVGLGKVVDLVLGEKLHRVGLEGILDVFLQETLHQVRLGEFMDVMIEDTLHRVGLGDVLDVVIEETLHQVGLGEFLDVVLGEILHRGMTRSRAGCGTGKKISLHLLEIRPKEVRLCNFVYNILIIIIRYVTRDSYCSSFVRFRTVRRLMLRQKVA